MAGSSSLFYHESPPKSCPSNSPDPYQAPFTTSTTIQHPFPSLSYTKRINGRSTPDSFNSSAKEKTSLDLTQRLEKKLAEYNASKNIFKRWLFEIASWLVSALCMGTLIGIYLRINGRNMIHSGTLLTFASILGKIASAALIVPTSEALGQLKWNWFHNSRAMWDFEIFDKASRGPWGAALLLFRTKGRSLAALGALLIVLLLAIDNFFQQVATFSDQWALQNTSSTIPRLPFYNPFYTPEFFQGFEMNFRDPALRPVISQFFIDNGTQPILFGNGTRPNIPLSCPTSHCTWPKYETLAVCSECVAAPTLLEWGCLYTRIDWTATFTGPLNETLYPNGTVCGFWLNKESDTPLLMSGYICEGTADEPSMGESLLMRALPLTDMIDKSPLYGGSINFKHYRNPILDALIVSATDGPSSVFRNDTPVIHECVLTWCVQTIQSSYTWGNYEENVTSKFLNATAGPSPWESVPVQLDGDVGVVTVYSEDINLTPPSSSRDEPGAVVFNDTYQMSNTTMSNVMIIFDDFFPSYYTAITPAENPMLRYKNFLNGPSLRKLQFNPLLAPNNVTHHFERLATAMTNVVRSSPSEMLHGEAYDREQFVSVQWAWLTFPLVLLVLSLVFLVSTIIKTSKDLDTGVWKTSAMPTLIYSLPKETQSQFNSSSTWSSAEGTKKVRIRLLPNMGWRVSGHSQTSASPKLPTAASRAPRGWIRSRIAVGTN